MPACACLVVRGLQQFCQLAPRGGCGVSALGDLPPAVLVAVAVVAPVVWGALVAWGFTATRRFRNRRHFKAPELPAEDPQVPIYYI